MFSVIVSIELTLESLLNDSLINIFPGYEKEIGILGFTSITFGFISNIIVGYIIDKTKAYKIITIIIFGMGSLFALTWTLLLEFYRSFPLVGLTCSLFIVTNLSYFGVSMNHITTAVHPISPGISVMVVGLIGAIYGNLTAFIGSLILEHAQLLYVNIMLLVVLLSGLVMSFFVK